MELTDALRVKDFTYKTLGLVRISVLMSAITKSFLVFFSVKLFYILFFSCVCIARYKHSSRGWENSRQLFKPSTSSRVCITVKLKFFICSDFLAESLVIRKL